MNEKESTLVTGRDQEKPQSLGYDESRIVDEGVIDPESVRIQYPQPKELIIRPRGRRLHLPNGALMDALKNNSES